MTNNDCFCPNASPLPYQIEPQPCSGENCIYYKLAMMNPKVKEIMDYTKEKIQAEENPFAKIAWGLAMDGILKAITAEGEKTKDEIISQTN